MTSNLKIYIVNDMNLTNWRHSYEIRTGSNITCLCCLYLSYKEYWCIAVPPQVLIPLMPLIEHKVYLPQQENAGWRGRILLIDLKSDAQGLKETSPGLNMSVETYCLCKFRRPITSDRLKFRQQAKKGEKGGEKAEEEVKEKKDTEEGRKAKELWVPCCYIYILDVFLILSQSGTLYESNSRISFSF